MEPIKYNKLVFLINELKEDIDKFYIKGNQTAGIRIRKSLQEVKDLSQDIRLEVTKIKKTK